MSYAPSPSRTAPSSSRTGVHTSTSSSHLDACYKVGPRSQRNFKETYYGLIGKLTIHRYLLSFAEKSGQTIGIGRASSSRESIQTPAEHQASSRAPSIEQSIKHRAEHQAPSRASRIRQSIKHLAEHQALSKAFDTAEHRTQQC